MNEMNKDIMAAREVREDKLVYRGSHIITPASISAPYVNLPSREVMGYRARILSFLLIACGNPRGWVRCGAFYSIPAIRQKKTFPDKWHPTLCRPFPKFYKNAVNRVAASFSQGVT